MSYMQETKTDIGKPCSCGRHKGVGQWDAYKRAAIYKRMITELPAYTEVHMREYVKSFEAAHGKITYELGAPIQVQNSLGYYRPVIYTGAG